eukprot:scaffold7101_cov153-Amphora_coffeaeformis.AAC.14
MERLYETSTMDSPAQSDDDSRPEEERRPPQNSDEKNLPENRKSQPNENLTSADHEQSSTVANEEPYMNVQPRPRSPGAFSEVSRPDPPSIIDHRVLDDLNDDDWEEEQGAAGMLPPLPPRGGSTTNSPTSRRGMSEHQVDGKFIQQALSSIEVPQINGADHSEKHHAGEVTAAVDLVNPSEDTFPPTSSHPEKSPQDTFLEEEGDEDRHQPEEPPALLKQSTSTTNLGLQTVSATEEDPAVANTRENGNGTRVETERQQQEPPAISPEQPYKKNQPAKGAIQEQQQQAEETPVVANGKSLERQNSREPHPLSSSNTHGQLASPAVEAWVDAAQSISPTQLEVPMMWGNSSPTTLQHGAGASIESRETASEPERMSPTRSIMSNTPIRDDHRHHSLAVPPHQHAEAQSTMAPGPAFAPPTQKTSYGAPYATPPFMVMNANGTMHQPPRDNGRRKIHLHMQEDVQQGFKKSSFLGHFRTRSQRMIGMQSIAEQPDFVSRDRGLLSVSWFSGTSAIELQEHVRRSVVRKLQLPPKTQLADLRILDETMDPPEGTLLSNEEKRTHTDTDDQLIFCSLAEIVLSPHIPDGSTFTLRFGVNSDGASTPGSVLRPPDSPSAAPEPQLAGLSKTQVKALTQQLDELRTPMASRDGAEYGTRDRKSTLRPRKSDYIHRHDNKDEYGTKENNSIEEMSEDDSRKSDEDDMLLHSEDPIEARLREITELLLDDRQRKRGARQEKRQVVFVLMNYFILFLGLIALSAELQARAPEWLASLEKHFTDVRDCSADQEALFECVSRGDFAGLVASVVLYLSRSVIPRRIFLFGFESPKKLWTVVYESLVTAFCWGCSYLFIRRGMNADTRERFLQKYWKDAVYGSLAGFNAAFMKQVLKNLIPQEAVEDVLRDRQLRFLSWLPSFE